MRSLARCQLSTSELHENKWVARDREVGSELRLRLLLAHLGKRREMGGYARLFMRTTGLPGAGNSGTLFPCICLDKFFISSTFSPFSHHARDATRETCTGRPRSEALGKTGAYQTAGPLNFGRPLRGGAAGRGALIKRPKISDLPPSSNRAADPAAELRWRSPGTINWLQATSR
jgi:hypothetical protein